MFTNLCIGPLQVRQVTKVWTREAKRDKMNDNRTIKV